MTEEERRHLDGLLRFFMGDADCASKRVIRYFQSRGWLAKKSGPLEVPSSADGTPGMLPRAGRLGGTISSPKIEATGQTEADDEA